MVGRSVRRIWSSITLIDIAFGCETWLEKHHTDDLLNISRFKLTLFDRVKRRGGDVCCYVKQLTIVMSSVPDSHHELLWLGIKLAGGDELICGVCYHHPKPLYDIDTLITRISTDLEEIVTAKPGQ